MSTTYGSVCSGIEAATLAWHPLGWQPAWFSEIEPFPSAVLAHRWPHVPNLGDMTKIAAGIRTGQTSAPDVLVGGTPCQAFSVAGLRGGLADARGQLTLSYVELANAIDTKRTDHGQRPAIFVWENVPGVLTDKTNAFGCLLAGLAGEDCPLEPAGGKWTNAGVVYGPQRTIAWRVLDAQFVGVAQRRRRVFVVASARPDVDPGKILFEFDGVRRDIAPRREAQPVVAALTARGVGTCGADDNQGQAGLLIPMFCMAHGQGGAEVNIELSPALTCNHESPIAFNWQAGGNTSASLGADNHITGTLQASQHPAVCVTGDITHTLKGEGYDGSEDGTGRGQPIVAFAENSRGEIRYENGDGQIAGALSTGGGKAGQGTPCIISFSSKDYGGDVAQDVSPTLRVGNSSHSHANGGQPPAIAYCRQHAQIGRRHEAGPQGKGWLENVAFTQDSRLDADAVSFNMLVRRLMPVECERLQGMPDNHTMIPWRGKPAEQCPDGPRYKAIGNSMAVTCMAWIGERIDREAFSRT